MKFYTHYLSRFLLTTTIVALCACGGGGSSDVRGYVSFKIKEAQKFNHLAKPGNIKTLKVIFTSDALSTPIIKEYPYGTDKAVVEGFPDGAVVNVEIQAINGNDYIVRRGIAKNFVVQGGASNSVLVTINNVPIFSNVVSGQVVNTDRFMPQIFAPGGIQFEISDDLNGTENVLSDVTSGQTNFSINEDISSSTMMVASPKLSPGKHVLKVKDINTGESTTIDLVVEKGSPRPVFVTTAGAYVGSPMSAISNDTKRRSDLFSAQRNVLKTSK